MSLPTFYNPSRSQLRLWISLDRAQVRRREGLFLAEGYKVVSELLKSPWRVRALLVVEQKKARWDALLREATDKVEVFVLSETQWDKLSQDVNPEGIMAVAEPAFLPDLSHLPREGHILLAYGINNPNNLGALLRTAHWFGFGAILLSGNSVDFTNPKVVRASMGSLFHLSVMPDLDFSITIGELKERYFLVAGHARDGAAPHSCSRRIALLMGSESHGLPDSLLERADERWRIPGAGGAESLSLPQAAAIMMYEAVRQLV